MPTVEWFLRKLLFAPLLMLKPPIEIGPWATTQTVPSAARNGVMISVPPSRLLASPSEETVTSMRPPALVVGSSDPVTSTAATFLSRISAGSTVTPRRSSMVCSEFTVNAALWPSPVPPRPTTSP